MRSFMLIAAVSLALAGCGVNKGVEPLPPAPTNELCPSGGYGQRTLADEKALYAAEVAYNVPAQAYVTLNRAGKLSPATKATVKPLLQDAAKALLFARQLYCTANTVGLFNQIAAVYMLSNQASAYLPKR